MVAQGHPVLMVTLLYVIGMAMTHRLEERQVDAAPMEALPEGAAMHHNQTI
jgi:hypothetical protein